MAASGSIRKPETAQLFLSHSPRLPSKQSITNFKGPMTDLPAILIADDDDGHAFLIEDNLRQAGVTAPILRFSDGQEVLDFLFGRTKEPHFESNRPYLLLLDIRMPKVD